MIRQQLIAEQAGMIADLLGLKVEDIKFDSNGIKLDFDQMSALILALSGRGYQNAIDVLKANGEASNAEGPDRNLTQWAVMVSAASFLEGVR